MQDDNTIVVLEGDDTGQELLEEALRVLAPGVIGVELEFPRFDLSLENRRATKNAVVYEAAAAIRAHGLGLKAATVTPEGRDDVGSPNRILREEIGGKVIVRTGRRIPGVVPIGGVYAPISIVRMAVGDAYGAKEWREGEGDDEVAYRTERIERRVCRAVSEFAFRQAARTNAKVFGGPKYTVSPTYEGMLKEEMDAADRHDPRNAPPRADDHLAADLLTEDPIWRADVVTTLWGDRCRLQPKPVRTDGGRRLVDDRVLRRAPFFEREIETRELELHPDHAGSEDAQGLLEQLLARLIALEDDDRVVVLHRVGSVDRHGVDSERA